MSDTDATPPRSHRWLRWALPLPVLAALAALALFALYDRGVRVGDNYWGRPLADVEGGIRVRVDSSGRGIVAYRNNTQLPADGLSFAVVTLEDHNKDKERLAPFLALVSPGDWPLVVFFNASGFDASGEPVAIRRVADGGELYRPIAADKAVALALPRRAGGFVVYHRDGGVGEVNERDWVEKYLRLPYQPTPSEKDLEKLSDEELKKLGYERLPLEEARKRGLVDDKGKQVAPPGPGRLTIRDLEKPKEKLPEKLPEKLKEKDKS